MTTPGSLSDVNQTEVFLPHQVGDRIFFTVYLLVGLSLHLSILFPTIGGAAGALTVGVRTALGSAYFWARERRIETRWGCAAA